MRRLSLPKQTPPPSNEALSKFLKALAKTDDIDSKNTAQIYESYKEFLKLLFKFEEYEDRDIFVSEVIYRIAGQINKGKVIDDFENYGSKVAEFVKKETMRHHIYDKRERSFVLKAGTVQVRFDLFKKVKDKHTNQETRLNYTKINDVRVKFENTINAAEIHFLLELRKSVQDIMTSGAAEKNEVIFSRQMLAEVDVENSRILKAQVRLDENTSAFGKEMIVVLSPEKKFSAPGEVVVQFRKEPVNFVYIDVEPDVDRPGFEPSDVKPNPEDELINRFDDEEKQEIVKLFYEKFEICLNEMSGEQQSVIVRHLIQSEPLEPLEKQFGKKFNTTLIKKALAGRIAGKIATQKRGIDEASLTDYIVHSWKDLKKMFDSREEYRKDEKMS